MEWLKALVLGLIQGLTEFLPVSSSGHLELGKALLGTSADMGLLFSIVVHAATALSTVVVFRRDIGALLRGMTHLEWNEHWRYASLLALSMVPVLLVGVLLKEQVESLFDGRTLLVGSMLVVTGVLLWVSHRASATGGTITTRRALVMGVVQALAILPGISRSGSTIAAGLLAGAGRAEAARFSFLMVLVPIFGATLLEMTDFLQQPQGTQSVAPVALAVGFAAAFLSGLWACSWMVRLVKRRGLMPFAIYCMVVGTIAIVWTLAL